MNESLFIQLVVKYFRAIAGKLTETFNGKKQEPTYLHDQMLDEEYSVDLKWKSSSIDGSIVAADVVAMDSPLPLKKRDVIEAADGDIPKLGMKKALKESDRRNIMTMAAQGATEAMIAAKLFNDAPKCAKGIKERLEAMFLQALSTGVALTTDEDNSGVAIRVDYGFKASNKFGAVIKWGADGYKPISDVSRVIAANRDNDGDPFISMMLSTETYNKMRVSDEGKSLSANYRGLVFTSTANLPTPTPSQFNEAFKDEYGLNIELCDRIVKTQKNGKDTNQRPFDKDAVVFRSANKVGRLVYSSLAEELTPVAGVQYAKVGTYILISKYSKNDPLQEFTTSQAHVIPVIDNVDSIYILNTQEAQEINETNETADTTDVKITIWGTEYTKATVITKYKALGFSCPSNVTDATLLEKINALSDEQEAALKASLS